MACFDILCTCKATSLSKMAKLVWRYSDNARATIENVCKFCMEQKKVWNETVTESCMGQDCSTHWREQIYCLQDEQQQPKQPPSSTSKESLGDFDQGVVRKTIARMYSLM